MDTEHVASGLPAIADVALGPASQPAHSPPAESNNTSGAVERLVDLTGVTWVRHFCRSCHKTPLWAVLGEPTPMCRDCQEWMFRPEPLGNRRVDRMESETRRHEQLYHGDRPQGDG
jgi:hypothetical protein